MGFIASNKSSQRCHANTNKQNDFFLKFPGLWNGRIIVTTATVAKTIKEKSVGWCAKIYGAFTVLL